MNSWVPNIYFANGQKKSYPQDYLDKLLKVGQNLNNNKLPVIFTLGHLSSITQIDYKTIYALVGRNIDSYRSFVIKKYSGGYRQINVPIYPLLKIQSFISNYILSKAVVHFCSTAYAPSCSPYNNALKHCGAKWLIKMDIVRFFESISERQVYYSFQQMGYPSLLSFQFARLTTINDSGSKKYKSKRWHASPILYKYFGEENIGHLPQGAPTSPMLSNIVCRRLDERLLVISDKFKCNYTRYADDITFSCNDLSREIACKIIRETSFTLSKYGFKTNHKKTNIIPPGARKIVTGLIVDGDEPKIRKELKDKIENHLYFCSKYGIVENCKKCKFISLVGFYKHLQGLIIYVKHIDNTLGVKYLNEFNSLPWDKFIIELATIRDVSVD